MTEPNWIVLGWEGIKGAFVPPGAAARTVLHIHLGLAVYLGIAAISRKGLRSWLALAIVIGASLAGEWADLSAHGPDIFAWLWRDTIGDVLSTIFWPLVLSMGAGLLTTRVRATQCGAQEAVEETASDTGIAEPGAIAPHDPA